MACIAVQEIQEQENIILELIYLAMSFAVIYSRDHVQCCNSRYHRGVGEAAPQSCELILGWVVVSHCWAY